MQCLPIGCIGSFGTFSCICGCGMFTNWLHYIFWDVFLAFVGVVGVWVVVEMKRIRGSSRDRRSCNWDLLNVTFLRIRQWQHWQILLSDQDRGICEGKPYLCPQKSQIKGSSQDRRSYNWDLLNVTFLQKRQWQHWRIDKCDCKRSANPLRPWDQD